MNFCYWSFLTSENDFFFEKWASRLNEWVNDSHHDYFSRQGSETQEPSLKVWWITTLQTWHLNGLATEMCRKKYVECLKIVVKMLGLC